VGGGGGWRVVGGGGWPFHFGVLYQWCFCRPSDLRHVSFGNLILALEVSCNFCRPSDSRCIHFDMFHCGTRGHFFTGRQI
jgi:hypothetical protein